MEGRRRFIMKGATLVAAGAAAAVVEAPSVIAQPKFQWRMSTTWTPALDVLQGAAQRLGKIADDMSGGRLKIQVFAGGELMPHFGCFDAASQGTIECFMGAPYYWAGKDAGFQWFSAVPFGLNPQGQMTWYLDGGGLKLWEEAYAPFSLVPRPGPSTGVQMAGWFRTCRSMVTIPHPGSSASFFATMRARAWSVSPILIGPLNFHLSPTNRSPARSGMLRARSPCWTERPSSP